MLFPLLTSVLALFQAATPRPAFDVTSVKPTVSTESWTTVAPIKNGRLSARNITAKELLSIAYKTDPSRILGGPKWLASDRFDVEAKCDTPPPDKELSLMLQSLLADRFQLKLHTETKVISVYALVQARNGARLSPAAQRDCPTDSKPAAGCTGMKFGGSGLTAEHLSMPAFATSLARLLGTSVLDETALSGAFDFKLDWIRDAAESGAALATSMDWIFSALPQQLGLKLEPRKTPTEVIVVDGMEKPAAN